MDNLIKAILISKGQLDGAILYRYRFERKVSGFFYAKTTGGKSVKISFGPYENCKYYTQKYPLALNETTGDDIVTLQYLDIEIEDGEPITVGIIDATYSYKERGAFNSDDELLNKIWQTGAYTVKLCTHRHRYSSSHRFDLLPEYQSFIADWTSEYGDFVIFDGPRRDRECWIGDIRTEALTVYSAFGDATPVKASIKVFNDLQNDDGLIPGSSATRQPFIEYNFWWAISVWECYLYTGDLDFLKKSYPHLINLYEYIEKNSDERALIDNDNSWMWTFVRVGKIGSVQCVLYQAVKCIGLCAQALSDEQTHKKAKARAARIKQNVNEVYWNEEKGVYDDILNFYTSVKPVFADFNCFAVCFGISDGERAKKALSYLSRHHHTPFGSTTTDVNMLDAALTPTSSGVAADMAREYDNPDERFRRIIYPHDRKIWPFVVGYEVEARLITGDTEGAFDLIRRCWGNMLREGATTFWEMLEPDNGKFPAVSLSYGAINDGVNSACHGWSGWITHLLTKLVLGVSPVSAGYKEFSVRPKTGNLKRLEGVVPTPYGEITVKITDGTIEVKHPSSLCLINEDKNFNYTITQY